MIINRLKIYSIFKSVEMMFSFIFLALVENVCSVGFIAVFESGPEDAVSSRLVLLVLLLLISGLFTFCSSST